MKDDYIRIPAQKFELHQLVVLFWNEQEHNTRITKRLFDLEDEVWIYQVAGSEQMYSSDALKAETDRPKETPKYAVGQIVGSINRPTDYRRIVEQVMWSEEQEYIYKLDSEELWFSEDELEARQ